MRGQKGALRVVQALVRSGRINWKDEGLGLAKAGHDCWDTWAQQAADI